MTSRAFSLVTVMVLQLAEVASRQVCWAHLKRDLSAERTGASAELGTLLEQQKHLFALWYQVRDGTLSRQT